MLASDGLSDPYPASESPPTGNGLEIVLESTDASIGVEMHEAYGVLSMSVPMGPDASEWVTADGELGVLPGPPGPRLPSAFALPAGCTCSIWRAGRWLRPPDESGAARGAAANSFRALAADQGLQGHRSAPGGGERKCQAPGRAFLQAAERDTAGASADQ